MLTVLWATGRAVLELRRSGGDRARVAEAIGETESEAWNEIERQLALLQL